MKVLFLDIDGVLNNAEVRSPMIDPEAIELLNRVVGHTGAVVVVSSMWRNMFTADDLEFILRTHGFNGRVIGTTPPRMDRSQAIRLWLDYNAGVTNWAAVDDEELSVGAPERCVQTSMAKGLTFKNANRLIAILGKAAKVAHP